jgi:hypothetical protein
MFLGQVAVLALAGTFLALRASGAPLMDAAAERAAAVEAEKKGDPAAALLHYENIFDSTVTDEGTRAELRAKFKELRPKVAPNTDLSKAGVWKARAYVFRTLDFSWKDADGKEHHVLNRFTDDEIEALRQSMAGFAERVWRHSWGNLRINWDLVVVEKPLTKLEGDTSFWPGPTTSMPYFENPRPGEVDTVFVFAKLRIEEGEQGGNVPRSLGAGTIGVLGGTKGPGYIGFNCGAKWGMDPEGEVEWHEWLHAAHWVIEAVQGYPSGLMASSDGGRKEGDDRPGGDPCFRLPRDGKTWEPFYIHIMEEHATRKMWREASLRQPTPTPWLDLYCRKFLVLGPFSTDGKPDQGLDFPFIDESSPSPKAGQQVGGLAWKSVLTAGRTLDLAQTLEPGGSRLAYVAIYVRSGKDQFAQVRIGSDDGCKLWHSGRLILAAPVERGAALDQNIVDVKLKKGANLFLVKVGDIGGGWQLIFRLTDSAGQPLPGIEYLAPGGAR